MFFDENYSHDPAQTPEKSLERMEQHICGLLGGISALEQMIREGENPDQSALMFICDGLWAHAAEIREHYDAAVGWRRRTGVAS